LAKSFVHQLPLEGWNLEDNVEEKLGPKISFKL
jgi:hypothetical protein